MSEAYYEASTNFYLFLKQFKRVLQILINGQIIVRDTIQSNWLRKTQAECSARELNNQILEKYCQNGNNLLRTERILSEDLFADKIQKNNILFQTNSQSIFILAIFENLIDKAIEFFITILIQQQKQDYKIILNIKNLFILILYRILEYANCLFQDFIYEIAIEYNLSFRDIVLFNARDCFDNFENTYNLIIISLNNRSISDLNIFVEVAREIPDKQQICVYINILI